MNHNVILSVRHIGMCYRRQRGIFGEKFWALKDVSFDLYHGETLGILGRNGSGKSTLMRLMSGIIQPDKGELINHNNYTASLLSLQLGFMGYLSGRENAILSGMLMGLTRKQVEAKMNAIIEFSELGEFIDQPISTYSSGMSARLGFSVAFQADPDILLVDEVMGVGDEAFKQKSTQVMREKIKTDKTVVLISHSGALIEQLCDRAVWIEQGVSRAEGKPKDVLTQYHQHITQLKKS